MVDEEDELELPPEDGDTDEIEVPLGSDITLPDAGDIGDPYDDAAAGDQPIEPLDTPDEDGLDDTPFEEGAATDELDVVEEAPWTAEDEGEEAAEELDDEESEGADDGSEGPEADDETLPELAAAIQGDDGEDEATDVFNTLEPFRWADAPLVEAVRHSLGEVAALGVSRGELHVLVRGEGKMSLGRVGPEGDLTLIADLPAVSRASFDGSEFLLEGEIPLRVAVDGVVAKSSEYLQEDEAMELPKGVVLEASTSGPPGVVFFAARTPADRGLLVIERDRELDSIVASLEPETRVDSMAWDPVKRLLWIGGPFGIRAFRRP